VRSLRKTGGDPPAAHSDIREGCELAGRGKRSGCRLSSLRGKLHDGGDASRNRADQAASPESGKETHCSDGELRITGFPHRLTSRSRCVALGEPTISMKFRLPLRVVAVAVLAACGPAGMQSYRGAGTISRAGAFPLFGLKIDLDSFNLGAPLSHRYSIEGLPKPRSIYDIGIVPMDPTLQSKQRPPALLQAGRGTLSIRLFGASGKLLFDATSEISDLSWGWREKVPFGYVFAEDKRRASIIWPEYFANTTEQPAAIEVAYEPGANAIECSVRLRLIGDDLM